MHTNMILDTDSYKLSHFLQYPAGTTGLRAYFEARTKNEDIRFFGLQYILQTISQEVTADQVLEANEIATAHGLPFPLEGWMKVVNEHGGKIPLLIKAVSEGKVVKSNNVLFTVESTDPELFWLVTWFETQLSRVWYPTTVASRSYRLKKFFEAAIETSSDDVDQLPFKLHDFGSRGVSSAESAGLGGMAHLLNFMGTDTIEGIMFARKYYGATEMPGFSIPASEHSTMTSWGPAGESEAYANMITQFGKEGAIFACVSDSYDIYNAVNNIWGKELRDDVIASGATLVVRPDSGNPLDMVMFCVESLSESFGYTTNSKGYKVLNNVRVIQGDGVGPEDIINISSTLMSEGWAIDNLAFGMGGGLLQRVDRDTHKFAYKVCEAKVDGEWRPVFKDPVGGSKLSKKGELDLIIVDGQYVTIDRSEERTASHMSPSVLFTVYDDGMLLNQLTFEQIKANA